MTETVAISLLTPEAFEARLPELADLLHACVHADASVNFIAPFPIDESDAFWRARVAPQLRAGHRLLWIADLGDRLAGSVQLELDTPPNQPHRAGVSKLLVHPEARRRGVARALMRALEAKACDLDRSLITLDTRTGDVAEPLYASMGYETAGVIPGYSRAPFEDRLESTTIMYKRLVG